MRIRLTIEVPDEYRRSIRRFVGAPGTATRQEVIDHVQTLIDADAGDLDSREGEETYHD